jgi:ribose transport system ATP-binding protein
MSDSVLSVKGAVKHFGGVQALREVDFDVKSGEIHALLGENGAGKSTLMNLLSGVYAPDEGTIRLDGKPVRFGSPRDAQAAGIATIFQELDLVPGLDVASNLFLGHELMRAGTLINNAAMQQDARKRLEAIDLGIDPAQLIRDLSVGQRQVVAIVKALSYATKVLIMDEPTAALTVGEVNRLFEIMRKLSASGVGIIYISHRLEEVSQIADRVTVMRDGRVAGVTKPDAPQAELVKLLVGRPLEELYPHRTASVGKSLLHLRGAGFRPDRVTAGWQAPESIDLDVNEGEIVGLAGIMGAGRTELLNALYGTGISGKWFGEILVAEKPAWLKSISAARKAGIAFVTDDRRGSGLMLRMSVGLNLVMSVIKRISPRWIISVRRQDEAIQKSLQQFDVRPRNPTIAVGALSGGNQQKVVLAKEVLGSPRLLLLDEPTRGVDVGAKGEIYARLRQLASQGLGILIASSEMPELIGLCDRIVVLRSGRTVAEFKGGVAEHTVLEAANSRDM